MTQLYGGAISIVELPSTFIDISQFRQVPDTQEVFMNQTPSGDENANFDQSLIFDLLEQVSGNDFDTVMSEHMEDIADVKCRLIEHVDNGVTRWYSYAALDKKDGVNVLGLFCLIRLENVKTDVLIQYYVPTKEDISAIDVTKSADPVIKESYRVLRQIGDSFTVNDWSLFG
ncbi:uncharacterized protein SPAPADRAFT_63216 [Spathaspora passalidarum NRRL Y-27907]|uniref:Mog1p/PsbP-like protein n=1 Tax=Spathaspora passalidarum (strain NRRL Y-27907 / 11-Y1) TaxID=619300 RepID=G3ATY9_SPAPN|nr:uncharacterized protein SPAPADRAFT_63216 [Spathaspora passalidarum NRRL Y-27907]EGW30365.1 hypothetical protein SPAPADRAFT_63216 [Spathaspora passalidarum NRRL Y-27907]